MKTVTSGSYPTIFVDVCRILNSFDIKMSRGYLGNKNAKDRVKEFPQDLYADHAFCFAVRVKSARPPPQINGDGPS
jgi:hypothetical protein